MVDAGRCAWAGRSVDAVVGSACDVVVDDGLFGRNMRDLPQREILRAVVDPGRHAEQGRSVGPVELIASHVLRVRCVVNANLKWRCTTSSNGIE